VQQLFRIFFGFDIAFDCAHAEVTASGISNKIQLNERSRSQQKGVKKKSGTVYSYISGSWSACGFKVWHKFSVNIIKTSNAL